MCYGVRRNIILYAIFMKATATLSVAGLQIGGTNYSLIAAITNTIPVINKTAVVISCSASESRGNQSAETLASHYYLLFAWGTFVKILFIHFTTPISVLVREADVVSVSLSMFYFLIIP